MLGAVYFHRKSSGILGKVNVLGTPIRGTDTTTRVDAMPWDEGAEDPIPREEKVRNDYVPAGRAV